MSAAVHSLKLLGRTTPYRTLVPEKCHAIILVVSGRPGVGNQCRTGWPPKSFLLSSHVFPYPFFILYQTPYGRIIFLFSCLTLFNSAQGHPRGQVTRSTTARQFSSQRRATLKDGACIFKGLLDFIVIVHGAESRGIFLYSSAANI